MHTIKRSSWHYRMAIRACAWPSEDICRYRGQVLGGIASFVIVVAIASFFAIWNLFGLWFAFTGGWTTADQFAAMNTLTLGIIAIIGTGFSIHKINQWRWRKQYENQTQPSLISAWYKSVKDRVCTPIKFID